MGYLYDGRKNYRDYDILLFGMPKKIVAILQ